MPSRAVPSAFSRTCSWRHCKSINGYIRFRQVTHCLVKIDVHQRKSEMSDIVSEESSMLGESNLWSPFSTWSTLDWMISRARCVTSCPGFAPLQRNVHLASLDQCASTSSGLCRPQHSESETARNFPLFVRLTPCQRLELLTELSHSRRSSTWWFSLRILSPFPSPTRWTKTSSTLLGQSLCGKEALSQIRARSRVPRHR